MFKRWHWVLLILAAATAYWRLSGGKDSSGGEPQQVPAAVSQTQGPLKSPKASVPPATPVSVSPSKAMPAVQALPNQNPGQEPKPPAKGLVEFEVKEGGLAVAFGDVVLGKVTSDGKLTKGVAQSQKSRLWESAEIPYTIDKAIANPAPILEAMEIFSRETSIRFVSYNGQKDSVVFVPAEKLCASYLGRTGGNQPVYISPQCGTNEVMHEIMHALGFVHEHSRPDRDKYVEVVWQNIDPQYWLQFWMVSDEQVHDYVGSVFSFDEESIMLYDATAFAKQPGTVTLKSKTGSELKPSRKTFSRTDRERLLYLYGS